MLNRNRKYLTIIFLIVFAVYSSGQAFLLDPCECCHGTTEEIKIDSCCEEEADNIVVKKECHSTDFNSIVKFDNPSGNSCNKCSIRCHPSDKFTAEIPTIYFSSSFELKKLEAVSIVNRFESIVNNNVKVKATLQNSDDSFKSKDFGKNLLIKIQSLKIPSQLS